MSAKKRVVIPRHTLSIKLKREIIEQAEKGASLSFLGKLYNVHRTTISKIIKRKESYNSTTQPLDRKNMREGNHPQLDQALFMWICEERRLNHIMTASVIKAKGIEFHEKLIGINGDIYKPFTAGEGWYRRFCDRFEIEKVNPNGEIISMKRKLHKGKSRGKDHKKTEFPSMVKEEDDGRMLSDSNIIQFVTDGQICSSGVLTYEDPLKNSEDSSLIFKEDYSFADDDDSSLPPTSKEASDALQTLYKYFSAKNKPSCAEQVVKLYAHLVE